MSQSLPSSSTAGGTSAIPGQNVLPTRVTYSIQPTTAAMSLTTSSTWQPPAHWNLANNNASFVKKVVKKKLRTKEEETLTSDIAARFVLPLVFKTDTHGSPVFLLDSLKITPPLPLLKSIPHLLMLWTLFNAFFLIMSSSNPKRTWTPLSMMSREKGKQQNTISEMK